MPLRRTEKGDNLKPPSKLRQWLRSRGSGKRDTTAEAKDVEDFLSYRQTSVGGGYRSNATQNLKNPATTETSVTEHQNVSSKLLPNPEELPAYPTPIFNIQPPEEDTQPRVQFREHYQEPIAREREANSSPGYLNPFPHTTPLSSSEQLSPEALLLLLTLLNPSAVSVAAGNAREAARNGYAVQNSDAYEVQSIDSDEIPAMLREQENTVVEPEAVHEDHDTDLPLSERDLNKHCRMMAPSDRPGWYIQDPRSVPEGHEDFLCGTCRHIDFIWLFQQEETNILPAPQHYVSLGPFAGLSTKRQCLFCSFACRIIVHHMLYEKRLQHAEHDVKRECLLSSELFLESFYICPIRYVNTYRIPALYFCTSSDLPSKLRRQSIATKAVRYGLPRTLSFRPMHKSQNRTGRFTTRDKIDFDWIRDRLQLCDERAIKTPYRHSTPIRAINVKTMSIELLPPKTRYCTLSYVWGKVGQYKLEKHNVSKLLKRGSLVKIMHLIPKTIRDAIILVQRIGESYLWVDALCIIQDDLGDKNVQIDAMGQIYRESVLCIQAVCGTDATHGLPGVETGSRNVQQFATRIPTSQGNLLLSNQLPYSDAVENSTWVTRAWTLQEKFLSQRMLVITDESVTYWCWHTSTTEDENCRHDWWPKGTNNREMFFFQTEHELVMSKIPRNSNFDIYAFTVFDYTKRNITKEEDAERAFQGVLDVFARLHRAICIFGIPDTAIEAGLMWCPVGSAVRRLDEKGRPLFPSWSWLGWKGAAGYPWMTEREHPISIKGSPLIWEDVTMRGDARWFNSLEFRHSSSALHRHNQDIYHNWELDPEDPWTYKTDFQEELRWIHPATEISFLGNRRSFAYLVPQSDRRSFHHRLSFTTLSAMFYLADDIFPRRENFDFAHAIYQQRIVDSSGYSAGYIYTPNPTLMTAEHRAKFRGRVELIVLSRTSINTDPRRGAELLGHSVYDLHPLRPRIVPPARAGFEALHHSVYFNTEKYLDSYPWCLFNVMMVEWWGPVAQRVAVGRVHIGAFLSANPTRKHIYLE